MEHYRCTPTGKKYREDYEKGLPFKCIQCCVPGIQPIPNSDMRSTVLDQEGKDTEVIEDPEPLTKETVENSKLGSELNQLNYQPELVQKISRKADLSANEVKEHNIVLTKRIKELQEVEKQLKMRVQLLSVDNERLAALIDELDEQKKTLSVCYNQVKDENLKITRELEGLSIENSKAKDVAIEMQNVMSKSIKEANYQVFEKDKEVEKLQKLNEKLSAENRSYKELLSPEATNERTRNFRDRCDNLRRSEKGLGDDVTNNMLYAQNRSTENRAHIESVTQEASNERYRKVDNPGDDVRHFDKNVGDRGIDNMMNAQRGTADKRNHKIRNSEKLNMKKRIPSTILEDEEIRYHMENERSIEASCQQISSVRVDGEYRKKPENIHHQYNPMDKDEHFEYLKTRGENNVRYHTETLNDNRSGYPEQHYYLHEDGVEDCRKKERYEGYDGDSQKQRDQGQANDTYKANVRFCHFYNRNGCTKPNCKFLHDISPLCIQYQKGNCRRKMCQYRHEQNFHDGRQTQPAGKYVQQQAQLNTMREENQTNSQAMWQPNQPTGERDTESEDQIPIRHHRYRYPVKGQEQVVSYQSYPSHINKRNY